MFTARRFPTTLHLLSNSNSRPFFLFTRHLHDSLPPPSIPPPTTRTPDVTKFLEQIGRNTIQHAPKFETWEQFFSLTSKQLRDLGVEPPRDRRYILHWRERYRVLDGDVVLKEHKRGVKVDGGERRRASVLAKRRAEERKEQRKSAREGVESEKGKYL
ncbi:IGR protein motif-domain-containing protein [Tuber borchii]|uniref:Small ribosomal subunit protein mS41 n=1 Tax=Tuber borchii TaxID=42251 RepID=A0A2T6ZEB7_TUBBO|nr:IGR protein motif-domain-containing protein [Tuber borchii]